ncbi:cellulose binding domain-containing protein [Sphaerisporangium sp. NPDC004334]
MTWNVPSGQTVTQAWNPDITQSGANVTAKNVSHNGAIETGESVAFGSNGAWTGGNPVPGGSRLTAAPAPALPQRARPHRITDPDAIADPHGQPDPHPVPRPRPRP